jgi:hypothetical protein
LYWWICFFKKTQTHLDLELLSWKIIMFYNAQNVVGTLAEFNVQGVAMRYSNFVPRLYNLCCELGMKPGKIMPSRAFCADENQGFPIILLAKHFGTFPFNHGRVGGIVATDRHGPHANHGKDLLILHASHVGYDPQNCSFGNYHRMQMQNEEPTPSCGRIHSILGWYLDEYNYAANHIFLNKKNGVNRIIIDNQLMHNDGGDGLFLHHEKMLYGSPSGGFGVDQIYSTSKAFIAHDDFVENVGQEVWLEGENLPIGGWLCEDLFYFKKTLSNKTEDHDHLERNLLPAMPSIMVSPIPMLTAAQVNSQVEFDRVYRSIAKNPHYHNKRLLFVAGLNIDISPQIDSTDRGLFPLTKFVPWAACFQDNQGVQHIWEQDELVARLENQSRNNPDQIDLEKAIQTMEGVSTIPLHFSKF